MIKRRGESGNVFFTLFGAIALVGVVGMATSTLMRGPVGTVISLNQQAKIESQLQIARKLAALEATTVADCDGDQFLEPLAPDVASAGCNDVVGAGSGCIPATVGASKEDPWGTIIAYCGWNHGPTTTGCGERYQGTNDTLNTVLAVISAGPDGTFQTTCAADPTYITTGVGSDDIIMEWTYEEASQGVGGGLWEIKSGDNDTIQVSDSKAVEFSSAATFSDAANFGAGSFLDLTGGGLFNLPDEIAMPDGSCTLVNTGILRRQTGGGASETLQICDGNTTTWQAIGGAGGTAAGGSPGQVQFNSGGSLDGDTALIWDATNDELGIGVNPDNTLDVAGTAQITGTLQVDGDISDGDSDVTINDGLNVTGAGDFDSTLNADGNTTLTTVQTSGLATLNSASVSTTLGVTGHSSLSTLGTSGLATLNSASVTTTLGVTGATTLSNTLRVDGDISDGNSAVTIADDLEITGDLRIEGALSDITDGAVTINDGLNVSGLVDVDDAVKVAYRTLCDPNVIGAIRYNSSTDLLELCSDDSDGGGMDDWVTIGTDGGGGGGSGGLWNAVGDGRIYYNDDDVGIGTNDPLAPLHVVGDVRFNSSNMHVQGGDLALKGTHTGTASVPATGAGARLMFDEGSSALRAGQVTGAQWDDTNIGDHSVALGLDAVAVGNQSFAFGKEVIANANNSVAFGLDDGAPATDPAVTAAESFGIFMGNQNAVSMGTSNIMALLGGRMVIDPSQPATQTNVSTGGVQLELDVQGEIGALQFCDEAGNFCFTASDVANGTLSAPGADRQIIFNSNGEFHAEAGFQFTDGQRLVFSSGSAVTITGGNETMTGTNTTILGFNAGNALTTAPSNTFLGTSAGAGATGGYNVVVGAAAGNALTTGQQNVLIGADAGHFLGAGGDNVMIGRSAGQSSSGTSGSVFVGAAAGQNTTGGNNTFIGRGSGTATTSGLRNTFIGDGSGGSNVDGDDNIIIGEGIDVQFSSQSNFLNIGDIFFGTGVGTTAGSKVGAVEYCDETLTTCFVAGDVGNQSAPGTNRQVIINDDGDFGTVSGFEFTSAARLVFSSAGNVFIAGGNETYSGSNNTILGDSTGGALTSGSGSVLLGRGVGGTLEDGDDNILIGPSADVAAANTSNYLNIGDILFGTGVGTTAGSKVGAVEYCDETLTTCFVAGDVDDEIWQAGSDNDIYYDSGTNPQVGIGTSTPGSSLEIVGEGATSATSSLKITNSAGRDTVTIRDDGSTLFSVEGTVPGVLEWQHVELPGVFTRPLMKLSYGDFSASNTVIGFNTGTSLANDFGNNTIIGNGSGSGITTGQNNIILGALTGLFTTSSYNISIGRQNDFGASNNSIALGNNVTIGGPNQFVIGGPDGGGDINMINSLHLGGYSTTNDYTMSKERTFTVMGYSSGASDKSAANATLNIAGAVGTGSGLGGDVVLQVAPAGSSGSSRNALIDALTVKQSGNVGIGNGLSSIDDLLHIAGGQLRIDDDTDNTNKGCIRYVDGTQKLQFSHDCSSFTDFGIAAPADPDRGIQFNSGGNFMADTNFVFTSVGRLGLGTNAPLEQFHLHGTEPAFMWEDPGLAGTKKIRSRLVSNELRFEGIRDNLTIESTALTIPLSNSGTVIVGDSVNRRDLSVWGDIIVGDSRSLVVGDSDTGIDHLADGQMAIKTNGGTLGTGTEIYISQSETVGINTRSPQTALDVDGTLKIAYDDESCDASHEGAIRYDSSADTFSFCALAANDWETISLGSGTLAALSDTNIAALQDGQFLKYDNGSSRWINATLLAGDIPAPGNDGEIHFTSNGEVWTDTNFVFTSTGRLGIGTATPADDLTVYGDSATFFKAQNDTFTIRGSNASQNTALEILSAASAGTGARLYLGGRDHPTGGIVELDYGDNSGAQDETVAIRQVTTGGTLTRFFIDEVGEIGMGGVTDPASALDFTGALTMREMTAPTVSPADQGRIYFDETSNKFRVSENGGAYVDLLGGSSPWSINGDDIYYDSGAAHVGIGLTDPDVSLDVDGTLQIAWGAEACSGNAAMEGAIRYDSSVNTFSFCADQANDWETVSLGAGTLAALSDTNIAALQDGQFLKYDNGSSRWINATLTVSDIAAPGINREIIFNSGGDFDTNTNFVFGSSGQLGIGLSNPNDELDVVGTMQVTGAAVLGSTLQVEGDISDGDSAVTIADALSVTGGIATFSDDIVAKTGAANDPSITFSGDTDTGFFAASSGEIGFTLDGTEHIRLTSAGALVIGDTSASAGDQTLELDVTGDVGAANYCDENGANCFTAATVTGGAGGLWTAGSDNDIYYNSGSAPTVGIGTTDPSWPLHVFQSNTSTVDADEYGLLSVMDVAPSANAGGSANWRRKAIRGYAQVPVANTSTYQRLTGVEGLAENNSTTAGATARVRGMEAIGRNNANATIGGVWGLEAEATSTDGTVTDIAALSALVDVTGGSATNMYGLQVLDLDSTGGTVTNRYGIYIDNFVSTATEDYGVYQLGGTKNYFADATGFGANATSPTTTLDVDGAFTMREMDAPTLSPADQGRIYFDSSSNKFRVSENGGGYVDLIQGNISGWTDAGTTVHTTTASDNVGIGISTADDALHVIGNIRIDDNTDGTNKGCLRYNDGTQTIQFSHDCSAFNDIGSLNDGTAPGNDGEIIFSSGGNFATETGFVFTSTGRLGVGTATPQGDLELAGTGGLLLPRGTIAQRLDVDGMIRYNNENSYLEGRENGAWTRLGIGLWTDSGSGYIEYDSSLGGARIGDVSGEPAPTAEGSVWTDSGAGYIEYSNVLGGARIANVTGADAPVVGGLANLDDIGDVSAGGASTGHVLAFNGTNWVAQTAPAGSLANLTDVNVGGVADGECLKYVTGSAEWQAGACGSGGGGGATVFTGLTDTPADYTSAAKKILAVNSGGDAVEYSGLYHDTNKLGIGTSTVDDPLHVIGNVRIDNDTNTTNKGCIRYNGTSNKIEFSHDCSAFSEMGTGSSSVWTENGDDIYYNSGTPQVGIGNTAPDTELEVTGGLCVSDASGDDCTTAAGQIRADGAITANAFDLAERYPAKTDIAPGTIVALDDEASLYVHEATSSDDAVVGIISTDPGLVLGWEDNKIFDAAPHVAVIALSGRVPLKVTGEGGSIAIGDRVALSSTAGHGMKATNTAGQIVGIALESFNAADPQAKGEVMVFAQMEDKREIVTLRNEVERMTIALSNLEEDRDTTLAALEQIQTDVNGLKAHTGYGVDKAQIGLWMMAGMGLASFLFFLFGGVIRNRQRNGS